MTDNLRAPVQGYSAGIPWSLHLRAWDAYAEKYGRSQSAERLAERGGFGASELDVFVPGWRDEVSEITRLQEALAAAEAERGEAKRIISECCNALPNGAMCRPTASLAFMADIPSEILAVTADLKSRAETAEAKLAALLALQENSNG